MSETKEKFSEWFRRFTGKSPYPWQVELSAASKAESRLIRIPTGFGKTLGVLGAWTWNRVVRKDATWPRRLVLCLPMRVLVEQTEEVVRETLDQAGLLRSEQRPDGVAVHLLMGGAAAMEWHLDLDGDAVLVGTQDMLLSRALNRGYAAPRARWPVELGLLTQDALWVLDEVQLMDVGLATSAQLEAFIAQAQVENRALRPFVAWWMSATLQRRWLESVDTMPRIATLTQLAIAPAARRGHLWDDVEKPVERISFEGRKYGDLGKAFAEQVLEAWSISERKLCLVVVNTVDRARAVYDALEKKLAGEPGRPDLRLVHSRFRAAERAGWRKEFLGRSAAQPPAGRIVVATQVVEAGVDLDANLLLTEIAPWPSLVQRFGRAARGGGRALVGVLDPGFTEDKDSAPYTVDELAGAREALDDLTDVSPLRLEVFEQALPADRIERLYPYHPMHLLLRREVDELFDTTPDLTGADLDISRFIRTGDERDVTVAWVEVPRGEQPSAEIQPGREALCAVPVHKARTWLCDGVRLRPKKRAWVWDFIEGEWQELRASLVLPGRILLVSADTGGYDPTRGFDPDSVAEVEPVASESPSDQDRADLAQDADAASEYDWKTIASHGSEVAAEAVRIAETLGLPARHISALRIAGLWHDLGKAHPAFQGSIRSHDRAARADLAKAPTRAWPRAHLYQDAQTGERRRGFRHELASALGLFAVLSACRPEHPALLGPWAEILGIAEPASARDPTAAEQELLDLLTSPDLFDLVVYLVASHHGKVRARLHAAPADQDYRDVDGRGQPIRGVREGDVLPPTPLSADGPPIPALALTLEPAAIGLSKKTGRSWTDRVSNLIRSEGPFALALLEACLRAADVHASRLLTSDPLLANEEIR